MKKKTIHVQWNVIKFEDMCNVYLHTWNKIFENIVKKNQIIKKYISTLMLFTEKLGTNVLEIYEKEKENFW